MRTIEVYGQIWEKVFIEPNSFIEALINNFLGHYQNWVYEDEKGSYHIMTEDYPKSERLVRDITKEEFDYYVALKAVKKFLGNERDAEIQKQREFEEFKKK